MNVPSGRLQFFALEAGDYLERLGMIVGRQTAPDADELVRLTRALRGAALMAGLADFSSAAGSLEHIAKAHRVIRKMRAGITWINTYHPTYNEAPWGGYKQSGIGRELGTYGYDAYTEVKQINVNLDVEPSGWFSE